MQGESMMARIARLHAAFAADGFRVTKVYTYAGRVGAMALHKTVKEYETGRGKAAFYVEGTPYERGYLMGMLAERRMAEMTGPFVDNILFDFLDADFLNKFPLLQKLVTELLYLLSEQTWQTLPAHIHEEVQGMLEGCKKSDPRTRVTMKRLTVLNTVFDVLCALAYSGDFLQTRAPGAKPEAVRLPMMCNAFSVFGEAAFGGHYFGRDFMFATGGVFHNNLAHIVHVPALGHPHLSVAAPGMAGAISAMNGNGVAVGVNMSPGANSTPDAVGLNSLLLARDCVQQGATAREAAGFIAGAQRGVAWNYPLSDGGTDTACTVEAGASIKLDFLGYPAPQLKPYLPGAAFFAGHPDAPVLNGAMVRWCGWEYPAAYFAFNPGLWKHYKQTDPSIVLYPDAFAPDGFINRTPKERNCPSSFYFAPQRTDMPGVHITGNHFVMPRMRLCTMDPWTAAVVRGNVNDIQWRYDALNHAIRETVSREGGVNYEAARRLADFLAPYNAYPAYYAGNPKSPDGKALRIRGCVTLFDLKQKTAESHYGYYPDGWVKTTLPRYLE